MKNPLDKIETLDMLAYETVTLGRNPWLRQELLKQPKSRQRSVLVGMLQASRIAIAGNVLERAVTRKYRAAGRIVLGLGYHSAVLADGDTHVEKILHRSAAMEDKDREEHLEQLVKGQNMLIDALGSTVEPQDYAVEPFLLDPARSVIVARQKRVSGEPIDPICDTSIEFQQFLKAADQLLETKGYTPDVVGLENIFRTDDGLKLVDTVPLSSENPDDAPALVHARSILQLHQ